MPHHLAIYDLDKTITRRPTWTPFLIAWARAHPARAPGLAASLVPTLGYAARAIDRARLKERTHALVIGRRVPVAALAMAAERFADALVADGVHARALDRIARDRQDGARLVLATASYAFYVDAIAERLGFDAVVATRATMRDGIVEARIHGENCYGAGKRRMVEAWLAREGIARADATIRFYSDHVSDAPMFDLADEAVAVNAHGPLRALAAARGWRMEDWLNKKS